uniref:Nudix hydrolase domain-containing protein n=1 Tax=Acrobeloides nanus TaxID=290746 RepID=A0A914CX31_9BILA
MKVNASKQQPVSHPRLSKEILTTTTATVKNSLRKSGDSAVLIPLVEMEDRTPWIIMTHRSYTLRAHRGEICFPGGKVEEDESSEKAALREAHEEIGLDSSTVKVLTPIRHMLTRRLDSKVTPVVGIVRREQLPNLKPIIQEVQCIYIIPLNELYLSHHYTSFRYGKISYKLPVFFTKKYRILSKIQNAYVDPENCLRIWGLSAAILNQLLIHLLPEELYKRDSKMPY